MAETEGLGRRLGGEWWRNGVNDRFPVWTYQGNEFALRTEFEVRVQRPGSSVFPRGKD